MRLGKHRSAPAPVAVAVPPPLPPRAPITDVSIDPNGRRLGELLLQAELLSYEKLAETLQALRGSSDKQLGRTLVERGLLDERDVARVLAQQRSLEFIDLRQVTPANDAPSVLPELAARSLIAIPVHVYENRTVVAVAEPSTYVREQLEAVIGKPVVLAVAAASDIVRTIGYSYRALEGVGAQVHAFEARDALRRDSVRVEQATASDDAPVVQVVQKIIAQGQRERASDIHIEPQEDRLRIRYRIDGALHEVVSLPASMAPAIASRLKILAGMNIVERRRSQDGQFALEIEGQALDVRVATTATIWGEKVVLRLLDKSRPLFELAQLGMPDDTASRYSQLLRTPYGMLICAGPTGGGKTTTLYASLAAINDADRNVMTIEDPVEYTFPLINQIQINEQAGITFAGGLKSILRQDPDIILVGEVRDVETARIAVQSALTGHLVLSSVHATDAVSALHRLLDMGIETFLVASSVTAVVAQRLVRRVCAYCRTAYEPTSEEIAFLEAVGGHWPDGGFVHGAGCNFCAHTGYLDRIGVYELLTVTEAVRELILDRASHEEIRKVARAEGMRPLLEEALRLVDTRVTTLSEVLREIYVAGG